jgi:hypothetical protein
MSCLCVPSGNATETQDAVFVQLFCAKSCADYYILRK